MSIPIRNADRSRAIAIDRTFFVTSSTWEKRALLQSARASGLLIGVLYHYRNQRKYLLHEFVIMPDHFHVLITIGAEMTRGEGGAADQGRFRVSGRTRTWVPRAGLAEGIFGNSGQGTGGVSEYRRIHSGEPDQAFSGDGKRRLSVFVGTFRICAGFASAAPKGAARGCRFRHR